MSGWWNRIMVVACAAALTASLFGQALECPEADGLTLTLDAGGSVVVPAFATMLRPMPAGEGWDPAIVFTQDPAAGTVIDGIRTIGATVRATVDGRVVQTCRFDVRTIDRSPPLIELAWQPADAVRTAPGGVPYVLIGTPLRALAAVRDGVDAAPRVTVTDNGQVLDVASTIDMPGLHHVVVTAEDASGNRTRRSMVLEVRDRPLVGASMATESLTILTEQGHVTAIDATVLLAAAPRPAAPVPAAGFPAADVRLSTLGLRLVGPDGRWLNARPIRVAGAYGADGLVFRPDEVEASYQNGYWRLRFRADLHDETIVASPVALELIGVAAHGSGGVGDDGLVDLRAWSPAAASADAAQTLRDLGVLFPDRVRGARPEPEPECQWTTMFTFQPSDLDDRSAGRPACGWGIDLTATPVSIDGVGWANAEQAADCPPPDVSLFGGVIAETGRVSSGGVVHVFMDGPPGCCADCRIDVTAQPVFAIFAALDPPASFRAHGLMQVQTACGGATAEGVFEYPVGDPDAGLPVPVRGPRRMSRTYSGALVCHVDGCSLSVLLQMIAEVDVVADAIHADRTASAQVSFIDAALNLRIKPTCADDVAPPIDPILIGTGR